ncbi:MAG: acyl carrier protein, partial [Kiloniellales bacterium]
MDAWTLIADIVQQVPPPGVEETPLQGVAGWDSLKLIKMVLRLEELLDRELSEDELEGLQTVGDVTALLRWRETIRFTARMHANGVTQRGI